MFACQVTGIRHQGSETPTTVHLPPDDTIQPNLALLQDTAQGDPLLSEQDLYFFHIVKEQPISPGQKTRAKERLAARPLAMVFLSAVRDPLPWWSWTGSNRRPPACKAGALPTELQPLQLGGSGWIRTIDPRLIKTML